MDSSGPQDRGGVSRRTVELVVAAFVFAFAVLLIVDALRLGNGWTGDGPEAGFYPFWIGLLMGAAALSIAVRELRASASAHERFIEAGRLKPVLVMLLPSLAFVAGIFVLGFYVSAFLFLAGFMILQGRMRVVVALPIAVFVPVTAFALFELWFKVPLPKGPVESLLGF